MNREQAKELNALFKKLAEAKPSIRDNWDAVFELLTKNYPNIYELCVTVFHDKNLLILNYINQSSSLWLRYTFGSNLKLNDSQEQSLQNVGINPEDLENILKTFTKLIKKHKLQKVYGGKNFYFHKENFSIQPKIADILRDYNIESATIEKSINAKSITISNINSSLLGFVFHLGETLYQEYLKTEISEQKNALLLEQNIKMQDIVEIESQLNNLYLTLSKEEIHYKIEFEYLKAKS